MTATLSVDSLGAISVVSEQIGIDPQVVEDLVVANRILFNQGVVDAFGHVSVRHPGRGDRFLLSRNMAPGLVCAEDLLEFDMNAVAVQSDPPRQFLERFIHSEIYKARPEVMAVVHSHSPTVVPFTVSKSTPLRAVCHMCGFIGTQVPLFEISDEFGDGTDLLIRSAAMGASLARSLGQSDLVMMRGHGSTVVARGIREAVYRAVYTEVNASTQLRAVQLGEPHYLSDAEAKTAAKVMDSETQRPWGLWKAKALGL
ncbi:class II aldolase/adducin family protein [Herbaspirillum lusitanum]|uniref:class II aldolase/adducin family protein n=1 Tax=Herbaspirillum lusitanum TaxID=213312 RepID=UPI000A008DFB|nr:class II aldolase/adducin family protein [Herbaspirillum lusitanum]